MALIGGGHEELQGVQPTCTGSDRKDQQKKMSNSKAAHG